MESDERAVRDLLEAERLEHRERELRRREDEEFVRRMQRREREQEETRVRQDEDAVRRMEEEELRGAIGVLECEVCYGENWRAELMVQCPEVRRSFFRGQESLTNERRRDTSFAWNARRLGRWWRSSS